VGVVDGRTWLEILGTGECWRRVRLLPVGRVGVLVDSAPEIYPVNYSVDGETIVFRTDRGAKLRGLDRSPAVCFQVDGVDFDDHTGWSVLIKGRAVEVTDTAERKRLDGLGLQYWTVGDKPHWIRIVPTEVTGRRITR
jgi:nitroimidazol reductase NimA-like FMN-containing flavoprotein (pyridoxamine 5'-phosphate oxidase superfamily)